MYSWLSKLLPDSCKTSNETIGWETPFSAHHDSAGVWKQFGKKKIHSVACHQTKNNYDGCSVLLWWQLLIV